MRYQATVKLLIESDLQRHVELVISESLMGDSRYGQLIDREYTWEGSPRPQFEKIGVTEYVAPLADRRLDTIIAALRYWQLQMDGYDATKNDFTSMGASLVSANSIASEHGPRLSKEEIDALVESLNTTFDYNQLGDEK